MSYFEALLSRLLQTPLFGIISEKEKLWFRCLIVAPSCTGLADLVPLLSYALAAFLENLCTK